MDAKAPATLQVRHEFPGLARDMVVRVNGTDRGRLIRGADDQWTPVLDGCVLDLPVSYASAVDSISARAAA